MLGLELTATPQTLRGAQAVSIYYRYPLSAAPADGFLERLAVAT